MEFPTLSAAEVTARLAARRAEKPNNYFAFYSSWIGGITTDPAAMVLPMDDHMVHRGHGVFDTATLRDGKLCRLHAHLDRLLRSAAAARLSSPLPLSREEMVAAIRATCGASGQRDASVRYWLSAGPGDFSFSPAGCHDAAGVFSVVVFGGFPMAAGGIAEVTVPAAVVPHKPPLLAGCKSNNYLLNVLTHLAARDGGGTFGIGVDERGYITEGAVCNASFVTAAGVLLTAPFGNILQGCTLSRALEVAVPQLIAEGLLTAAEQRPITLEEAKAGSVEVFLTGGDTHVMPVVRWDDAPVGDGEVGVVTARLTQMLERDVADNFDCVVDYG